MLEAARPARPTALAHTPDQLPVLEAAGVVDAGGAGIVLLLDAFLHVADGRPLPDPAGHAAGGRPPGGRTPAIAAGASQDAVGDLRYEVMYFLEAPDETIPAFRDVWAGVGDSIVVVGGDGLWNCHIHTDDIGAAVEAALDAGRPRRHPGHRPVRAGRGGALGPRGRRRPRRLRPIRSRSPARWWRSPPATGSGGSSARSASSRSSPAGSR